MRLNIPTITIPEILEVGMDKLQNTADIICKTGHTKIAVFYGTGIKEMFGESFKSSFKKTNCVEIVFEKEFDDIELNNLMKIAFSIPNNVEVIVGLGGGKVLDVAKYVAFLNNLYFISIPTSASNDGFASSGCSLIIDGKRTSVQAMNPYGIIVDIGIIKNSPEKFVFSGLGDIISKITAVYDWQYEEEMGRLRVNDFAVMIAKKSVNSIVRINFTHIKDDFFLEELVDSLTMSGIAMAIAGSSHPASGSEHLISHALDKILEKPQLHGIQVGIATYIMSMVQNNRVERLRKFLIDTGFFNFVKTLGMQKADFIKAIDLAPSIKPNRLTFIHLEDKRNFAKELLSSDSILNEILF